MVNLGYIIYECIIGKLVVVGGEK